MAILGADPLHHVLEPEIALLDCCVEHLETGHHGSLLELQDSGIYGNHGIDLTQQVYR